MAWPGKVRSKLVHYNSAQKNKMHYIRALLFVYGSSLPIMGLTSEALKAHELHHIIIDIPINRYQCLGTISTQQCIEMCVF